MSNNGVSSVTPDSLQPHNVEAEEAVLGSLLIDPDAIINVATFLVANDFYVQRHSWVYEAILDLHENRQPADLVTLADELKRRDRLEEIGGTAFLTSLMSSTPTSIHVEFYARIVERTAVLRRLIDAAGQIAQLAYQDTETVENVVDQAEEIIFAISQRRVDRDLKPIRQVLDDYYDRIDYLTQHQGEIIGIPTGLTDLDKLLGGLQRSDMVVMAGRPGMGENFFGAKCGLAGRPPLAKTGRPF
jgi:replicative DNA helicase